jgi:integrase
MGQSPERTRCSAQAKSGACKRPRWRNSPFCYAHTLDKPAAKPAKRLTAKSIPKLGPGRYRDPERTGLYLQVEPGRHEVTRVWIFRYQRHGREHGMGLGGYPTFSLDEARGLRDRWHKELKSGHDPIRVRAQEQRERRIEELKTVTFAEACETYLKAKAQGGTKSQRLANVMRSEFKHAMPNLGPLTVAQINRALVLKVLEPIWRKPTIGRRVRLALERIFEWAAIHEYRTGDNPAKLDDIKIAIPNDEEHKVRHHEAMPYTDVPALVARLRDQQTVEAAAEGGLDVSPWLLEFLILTAVRLGQVRKMQWREVDFRARMWVSPAEHTKAGTEHAIPLTDRAIALLQEMRRRVPPQTDNDLVFPGVGRRNTMQGRNTALRYLQRMGIRGPTIHGYRSAFKLWATKTVGPDGRLVFPRDLAELALHHTVGGKIELAYLRLPDGQHIEDFREERRPLMAAWADYISKPAAIAEVTELPAARRKAAS